MKKHLLLGSALVAAISAYPQSAQNRPVQAVNMAEKIASKFARIDRLSEQASTSSPASQAIQQDENPSTEMRTSSTSSVSSGWAKFTGSMNIYGVLVAASKPLQYEDDLNVVTFVHRKSATYQASPAPAANAANGVLVAMVSTNFGSSWDSTCVWNDNTNWARYPQGGVLNPAGNTNINNAYFVASAPITQANAALGWIGNGFSKKPMGTYNNTSAVANQTFVSNASPYGVLGSKVDFARLSFSSTDDGAVRMLGGVYNGDVNGTTLAAQDIAGAGLVTYKFVSGTPAFSFDNFIPSVRYNTLSNANYLTSTSGMAWSEDGLTGYVYMIGCRNPFNNVASDTMEANKGYQPIIYKTADAGNSWQQIYSMNFNDPTFTAPILDHLYGTSSNPTLTIPFFNISEGISATVDKNNNLHLVTTLLASYSGHPDSSGYTYQFNNYDGETYTYPHVPGLRPYLYDFTGSGNTANSWSVTTIDSLSSEDPGVVSTDNGYNFNPWDATGGSGTDKIDVDARIQVSRTPDGEYIVYTWGETDSLITTGGNKKWNQFPNVKARLRSVTSGLVDPTEINVTRLNTTSTPNPNVSGRGYNHYVSPKCAVNTTATTVGTNTVVITMPITVSNSPGALQQLNPVNHWYSSAALNFTNTNAVAPGTITAIADVAASAAAGSYVFPNPAKTNATLNIDLQNNSAVNVTVLNMVGQQVKTMKADGQIGANSINIDLNGLSKGIYMVNVKVGNSTSTKKLIVE